MRNRHQLTLKPTSKLTKLKFLQTDNKTKNLQIKIIIASKMGLNNKQKIQIIKINKIKTKIIKRRKLNI